MSALERKLESLVQIGQILADQAMAVGKHEQPLVTLYILIHGISAQLEHIQALLQPQGASTAAGALSRSP